MWSVEYRSLMQVVELHITFSEVREKLYGRRGTLHMGQLTCAFMLVFSFFFQLSHTLFILVKIF